MLTAVIADPDVHVVVFRPTGDHFSAGADLDGVRHRAVVVRDARRSLGARRVGAPARGRGPDDRVDAGQRGRVRVRARAAVRRAASRPTTASSRSPRRGSACSRRAARARRCRASWARARRSRPCSPASGSPAVRRARARVRRRGRAARRTACPHRRARRRTRGASARRGAGGQGGGVGSARPPARRGPGARGRPRGDAARRPDVAEWAPPSLGGCPHSRESSDPFPPVTTRRSTTSSAAACSGRCRAGSTCSARGPASAATA